MYIHSLLILTRFYKKKKEMKESESPVNAVSETESEDTIDRFHDSLQVHTSYPFLYLPPTSKTISNP